MTMQAKTQEDLRRIVDRLERIDEEIAELKADLKDTLANAKQNGFDPKIIRKCLSLRKRPQDERSEEEMLIDTYMHALEGKRSGDDTPMGDKWKGEAEARA